MSAKPHLIIGNKAYSSWSMRPWIAMRVHGIEFEETVINLYDEGAKENIRKHSPTGKVPVLKHGDVTIWESLAILDYLSDTFREIVWWPGNPNARALARSIAAEMHAGFTHVRSNMPMNVRRKLAPKASSDDIGADIARITGIWRMCRSQFGHGGPFLFGAFTNADAMFAPVVTRFQTYGIELDDVCRAYSVAVLEHPAMKRWYDEAAQEPWIAEKYE